MVSYGVTADEVRFEIGVSSSDINDTDMNRIIEDSEAETDQLLKSTFKPKLATENLTSIDGSNVLILRNTPVNRLVSVFVGTDNDISIPFVKLYNESGRTILTADAQKTTFDDTKDLNNFVKYYYSNLEESTTETTTSAAITSSPTTAIDITVGTTVGFATDDYIKLESVGGTGTNMEVTTITGTDPSTSKLQAKVSWNHNSGTRVVKMQIHRMAQDLTRVLAGIRAAHHMIGATYTFATSYSFPEHTVTKGVPYPHFERVANDLVKRRDFILSKFRPQFAVGV